MAFSGSVRLSHPVHQKYALMQAFKAAQIVPDADDTSKSLTVLSSLGRPVSVEPMVKEFKSSHHFKTYAFERNPSFTVNCNVLSALLTTPAHCKTYAAEIQSTVGFLCTCWWNTDGLILDKWVEES